MRVGKTAGEGWERPVMRAGACLGWRLRREAYCRFKGDGPPLCDLPTCETKRMFFFFSTGLTSQICCIKGLVCQEPRVRVTESERTVSITSAPRAFRLRKALRVMRWTVQGWIDSEEVFKRSAQRQINKGFIARGPNVQRVRRFLFYPTLYFCPTPSPLHVCDRLISTPFKYMRWFKNANVCVKPKDWSCNIQFWHYEVYVLFCRDFYWSMLTS